ncbi:MAG: hypothetical protein FK734_16650 [Asgard group archaeon]|nr:hypothetical protein [Asgard group archaeon]
MESGYSFDLDNSKVLNGLVLLRNGSFIFLITTILLFIESIFSIAYFAQADDFLFIITFTIEIFTTISGVIAAIIYALGLKSIKLNLSKQYSKKLKSLIYLLVIYTSSNFISSIFTLMFHIANEAIILSLGKNLILYSLIGSFLMILNFTFIDLQKAGYETKQLYIPTMALSFPILISFIAGIFSFVPNNLWNNDLNPPILFITITFIVTSIILVASFSELYTITRRMTRLIDKKYVYKAHDDIDISQKAVAAKK